MQLLLGNYIFLNHSFFLLRTYPTKISQIKETPINTIWNISEVTNDALLLQNEHLPCMNDSEVIQKDLACFFSTFT